MSDLASLNLHDVVQLGNKLRKTGFYTNCLEDVAQEVVSIIYDELKTGENQEKACSLVRFFKTHNFNDLEQEQKDFAEKLLPENFNEKNIKCLTLVATAGEKPEWNSRTESKSHKAIPLISERVVDKFPMISALYKQMGLDVSNVVHPDIKFINKESDKNFSVFYIPNANSNPSIPDQENFVIPHGIKSVIGFGGVSPTGEIFNIIIFTKTFLSKEVADLFQLLTIYIKIAILPHYNRVFKSQIKRTQNVNSFDCLEDENRKLKLQIEAYESVLFTYEKLVEKTTHQRDLILNSTIHGIYGLDLNGYTTFANPAAEKMLGYSLQEMLNRSQHDLIHHSKSDGSPYIKSECPIYLAFKDGKTHHVVNEVFWKKNGDSFPVAYTSTPIIENGVLTGAVVTFKDITKRKEAEKRMEMAKKQIMAAQKLAGVGELAAGVSHEVLNPVNILSVQTQMLQRKTKDDPNIQKYCSKVMHEIERIQKIVGSLLEFSRKGDAEFEKGNMEDAVEKTLRLVEEEYKLDNIKILREWCGTRVETLFDTDKIRQVYLNLLQNAKHAMPNGGTITVGCASSKTEGKNYHQFTFSDTGTGMSEEVRLKIFEPFFTTKPEGQGTGMGLAVTHGIIKEHGGKIRVESEEGKGTKFTISLPIDFHPDEKGSSI